MIQNLDNSNFQTTVDENEVILVDFYADWCGPCQALNPALEKIATELSGRAVVAKVNIEQNTELSARFGVRSIPALFYIKNGEVVHRSVGLQSATEMTNKILQIADN